MAVSIAQIEKAGESSTFLVPKRWQHQAEEARLFVKHIIDELEHCSRSPERLSELPDYRTYEDRLKQSLAFGQHLQRLPPERQEYGQFGMYGTAAGLELLASSEEAREFRVASRTTAISNRGHQWAQLFLKVWNFFDLMVYDLSSIKSSKFLHQSSTLLRTCHVLRAVAASAPLLNELSDTRKREMAGCDEGLVNTLTGGLTVDSAEKIAKVCYENILGARVFSREIAEAFRVSDDVSEVTFRFARGADEVPETWKDWIFVWGSVMAAVLRAARVGLLTHQEVMKVIDFEDLRRITVLLSDRSKFADERYRLFALWALDHLIPERYQMFDDDGPQIEVNIPELLLLKKGNPFRGFVESEVARTCEEVIKTGLWTDVHSQYQVYFKDETMAERYWYDYYVIPVLPVLLDLLARHKPNWLFRPRVADVWSRCLLIASDHNMEGNVEVLPFQTGNYNGTVNCLYYVEAALKLRPAIKSRTKRVLLYLLRGYLHDYRSTFIRVVLALIFALLGFGLLVFIQPEWAKVYVVTMLVAVIADLIGRQVLGWSDRL
jgi:hypothetical protein